MLELPYDEYQLPNGERPFASLQAKPPSPLPLPTPLRLPTQTCSCTHDAPSLVRMRERWRVHASTHMHTQTMCAHTDHACRVCALLSSQVRSCLLFAERFPPFASLADRFQRGALFVASHSNWLRNTLSTPKLLQLSALSQQARSMRVYEHVGRGGWMQMCGGCLCVLLGDRWSSSNCWALFTNDPHSPLERG